jgi:hypothetical protein
MPGSLRNVVQAASLHCADWQSALHGRHIMSIKKTKTLIATLTLILFSLWLPVRAQSPCKKQSVQDLAKQIAEAYQGKTLSSLDAQMPYPGRVRIVIENSLGEPDDKGRFVIKSFTSLAKAEAWLKSREHDGMPGRESRPLERCAKGVCTYNFNGGILHNHLYLKKISYGIRSACPYIKTIYLLDGD